MSNVFKAKEQDWPKIQKFMDVLYFDQTLVTMTFVKKQRIKY